MNKISAKIICDSINPIGNRLTTFVLVYPRYIIAELNTHKMLSKNSASSRAIPNKKMLKSIWNDPFYPISWGENKPGMQAGQNITKSREYLARKVWALSSKVSCFFSYLISKLGAHKQLSNRITEPYAWMTTVLSGTDFGNFFNLRCSPEAQPEFAELAYCILGEYVRNQPKELKEGEYHLPFCDRYLPENPTQEELIKISVARCARVSYNTFYGKQDFNEDYKLYNKLINSGHFSPTEHVARATMEDRYFGNFRGWLQHRKEITGENKTEFNADGLFKRGKRHVKTKNHMGEVE